MYGTIHAMDDAMMSEKGTYARDRSTDSLRQELVANRCRGSDQTVEIVRLNDVASRAER